MSIDERIDTRADEEQDGFDYDAPIPGCADLEAAVRSAEYAAYWQQRITEVGDIYDAEHQRLMRKLDALDERRIYEVGKLTKKYQWHQAQIADYHRRVLADDPKRKTLDLVHGSAKAVVPVKPQVFIDNADTVKAWAIAHHPEILRAPNVMDVRRVVDIVEGKVVGEDGEIVQGLSAQVPDARFSFEADPWSPL
jgi:hypothetical protein